MLLIQVLTHTLPYSKWCEFYARSHRFRICQN